MRSPITYRISLLILVGLLLTSCFDGSLDWDDMEIDWQTEIIGVIVNPNPVEVGETVTFTCIIKDSTDSSFEFTWSIKPNYWDSALVTSENYVSITAADTTGRFQANVTANNYEPGKVRAIQWFDYDVIEKQN